MIINYEEPTPKTTLFKNICVGNMFREVDYRDEIYIRIEDAIVGNEKVNCVGLFDGLAYYTHDECKCVLLSATLTVEEENI